MHAFAIVILYVRSWKCKCKGEGEGVMGGGGRQKERQNKELELEKYQLKEKVASEREGREWRMGVKGRH